MKVKKWLKRSIPVLLAVLFFVISVTSITTILRMQGNARVVNYTGIVRGATQRLVKQELNGTPNDKLIEKLEGILVELATGEGVNNLVVLPDSDYQGLLSQMRDSWKRIQKDILQVRKGENKQHLFEHSEDYFELADSVVSAAENYSEKQVNNATATLVSLNIGFILLTALFLVYGWRQRKTQAALDVAEHASIAKSEFLSRMSHEIRTPLGGIIGMTDIAKMYPDDPKRQGDCLNKISLSSKYLLALINDILDMSRIESGKVELEHRVFDLREMLSQIHGMFQQKAEDSQIHFQIKTDTLSVFMVAGDNVRLSQVLVNIVSNAIKFTPPGGSVILEVLEKSVSPNEVSLEFLVTDTGAGISEEFQSRIFEPFEQDGAATSRQYGGTGLGLAISSNFIKMMNGTLSVRSKPGEGSQFTAALTLERAGEDSEMSTECRSIKGAKSLDGTFVLLAEDNEINAEIVTIMLENNGASVKRAHNGQEAAALFNESPKSYTLILMDIQMPVMDGLEATRAIRAGKSEVPIIGLSANAFSEDIDKAIQNGMNGYLSKPVDMEKLLETVRQYT